MIKQGTQARQCPEKGLVGCGALPCSHRVQSCVFPKPSQHMWKNFKLGNDFLSLLRIGDVREEGLGERQVGRQKIIRSYCQSKMAVDERKEQQ